MWAFLVTNWKYRLVVRRTGMKSDRVREKYFVLLTQSLAWIAAKSAAPEVGPTGSFWTAWTLKIEAASSSTSPLTNRRDVIFQKTHAPIRRLKTANGNLRARFAASVQRKASTDRPECRTVWSSDLRRSNKQDNPRQLTCNNTPALPSQLYTIYCQHDTERFSFQCVSMVQNQS